MPRKRMIDPGIYSSLQFVNLNPRPNPQVSYIGTFNAADDWGILELDPVLLKSQIYPRTPCSKKTMQRHIGLILDQKLILSYEADERLFGVHPNWAEYQKLDNPGRLKNPIPPREVLAKCSRKTRDRLANASTLIEGKGREKK